MKHNRSGYKNRTYTKWAESLWMDLISIEDVMGKKPKQNDEKKERTKKRRGEKRARNKE